MPNTFLYYNYLPSLVTYCLEFDKNYYIKMGITPKHNYVSWKPGDVKKNDSIFVKSDLLDRFFTNIYPFIKTNFFLFSGNGGFDIKKHKEKLSEGKILKWISPNILWEHPKVFKIPIGFEENERCINGTASCNGRHEGGDQNTLKYCYNNKIDFNNKKNKLLITYCNLTHPSRKNIKSILDNNSFVEFAPKLRFKDYLNNINKYKFVLCPRGCGADTHRFWEVILVNSIPIVQRNELADLYSLFPCIIVDNFSDITIELLTNFKLDNEKQQNIEKFLLLDNFNNLIQNIINVNSI